MENQNSSGWEREVLTKLAFAAVKEQKKTRFWQIFFRFIFILMFLFSFVITVGSLAIGTTDINKESDHVAVVNLFGVIDSSGTASAARVIPSLQAAFANPNSRAVILRVDSPGGSPVQSGMIHDEIYRLKELHKKPIYAVVEDTCASGSYYVAVATDKIFVNRASVVGSIGVRMGGFGFVEGMKMVGVERRLVTAGKNKAFRDPFSEQTEAHKQASQALVDDVHQQFIDVVKKGRGDKLEDDPEIFSGMVWTGRQAVKMGLVDELKDINTIMREMFDSIALVDYSYKGDFLDSLSRKIGVSVTEKVENSIGDKNRLMLY